jgi:hypothetical protein
VSALVLTVSQPSDVLVVYAVGANAVRPIALKVALSVNFPSPAYCVRIKVGDSTWKRASPEVTDASRWSAAAAPAGTGAAPTIVMAAMLPARATTVARSRSKRTARRMDLLLTEASVPRQAQRPPAALITSLESMYVA